MESVIEEQIAELGRMTVTQLRLKHGEVFGEPSAVNGLWIGFVLLNDLLQPAGFHASLPRALMAPERQWKREFGRWRAACVR